MKGDEHECFSFNNRRLQLDRPDQNQCRSVISSFSAENALVEIAIGVGQYTFVGYSGHDA